MGSMKDTLPNGLYPIAAGFKKVGTSQEAARSVGITKSEQARADIVALLKVTPGGLTADEAAARLGKTVLQTRPRFSELVKLQRIVETGEKRRNESGKLADVWRAK